jgi:hypothetical protein
MSAHRSPSERHAQAADERVRDRREKRLHQQIIDERALACNRMDPTLASTGSNEDDTGFCPGGRL